MNPDVDLQDKLEPKERLAQGLATPQTNRTCVLVQSVVPAAGKFTIHLNKSVAGTTYVGFLVIN